MMAEPTAPWVALACGGTGGHLFPGLAVAHELADRGMRVSLLISPKEVDQHSAAAARSRFTVVTLPAVGLSGKRLPAFLLATWKGYRASLAAFSHDRPSAVLAMGGFTAAAPVLAGRRTGARVFLHESNTRPGRANRWLARWADQCLVGFREACDHPALRRAVVTGTPVRETVRQADAVESRRALGLAVDRPVLLITGGSQGARGVNQLMMSALDEITRRHPTLQFIHLTGAADLAAVSEAYRRTRVPARVWPFSQHMEQLLAAATVVVSRSGASSLAELAARRLPAVLIPYPTAADDHQRHNARLFVRMGAARLLEQTTADGSALAGELDALLSNEPLRESLASALAQLDCPEAASCIAEHICRRLAESGSTRDATHLRSARSQPAPARVA